MFDVKEEEVILPDDDRAAKKETVEGWVSRGGRFFGKEEHLARLDGATHTKCINCGTPKQKNSPYTVCRPCYEQRKVQAYRERKKKAWDGVSALYSESNDQYYFDIDILYDDMADLGVELEQMRLVICEPQCAHPIYPDEYYQDLIPEDGEVPDELNELFNELNTKLVEKKIILSWYPGHFAVDPESLP